MSNPDSYTPVDRAEVLLSIFKSTRNRIIEQHQYHIEGIMNTVLPMLVDEIVKRVVEELNKKGHI